MNTVYVGLDVGSSSFHQLVMLMDGATKLNRRYQMSEANLRTAFSGLGSDVHVHMEEGFACSVGQVGHLSVGQAGGHLASKHQRLDRP